MEWFYVPMVCAFALISLRDDKLYRGAEGRERLLALDAFEARNVLASYRSVSLRPWMRIGLMGLGVAYLVHAVATARWGGVAALVVAVAVGLVTGRSRARTAPQVLAILSERDLSEPSILRETSQRRRRRVKQYGAVAALAFVTALPPLIVGDSTLATVVGIVLLSVTGLALAAMAWASAWRYGDEQPVPEPDPTS